MPSYPQFNPEQVVVLDRQCLKDDRIKVFHVPDAYVMSGLNYVVPNLIADNLFQFQTSPIMAFRGRPLDRFTLYAARVVRVGGNLTDLPPPVRFDLRAGFNSITTLAASVTVLPPDWNDANLIFAFSGLGATQWEIWAGTIDGGPGRPQQPVGFTFDVIIDPSGCCEKETQNGPWVIP